MRGSPMRLMMLVLAAATLAACGVGQKSAAVAAAEKANLAQGEAYLAANAKAAGVVVLPSGLQYKVLASGPAEGLRPKLSDEVKVHYEGRLTTGEVFDSSLERGMPAAFPLEGLIPGWVEALQLMRPGDDWMLYVPAKLAYGDEQKGDAIPPNSVLVFRIQLLAVLPHGESLQRG